MTDIYEDQFAKKAKEKRERVAKNELQRLRNIARRSKSKGSNTVHMVFGAHDVEVLMLYGFSSLLDFFV